MDPNNRNNNNCNNNGQVHSLQKFVTTMVSMLMVNLSTIGGNSF